MVSATQLIQLGDASRHCRRGRGNEQGRLSGTGHALGRTHSHAEMTDMMLGALQDPLGWVIWVLQLKMGSDYDISRQDMDEFALASQQRAANA